MCKTYTSLHIVLNIITFLHIRQFAVITSIGSNMKRLIYIHHFDSDVILKQYAQDEQPPLSNHL